MYDTYLHTYLLTLDLAPSTAKSIHFLTHSLPSFWRYHSKILQCNTATVSTSPNLSLNSTYAALSHSFTSHVCLTTISSLLLIMPTHFPTSLAKFHCCVAYNLLQSTTHHHFSLREGLWAVNTIQLISVVQQLLTRCWKKFGSRYLSKRSAKLMLDFCHFAWHSNRKLQNSQTYCIRVKNVVLLMYTETYLL